MGYFDKGQPKTLKELHEEMKEKAKKGDIFCKNFADKVIFINDEEGKDARQTLLKEAKE